VELVKLQELPVHVLVHRIAGPSTSLIKRGLTMW
jgi:hypothetical protein